MAIDIPSNFNLGARLPLDARYIVNTYSELTGSLIKYSGMQGYVVENKKIYYLENLDTNNWVEMGAGAINSVYTTGNQTIGGIKNFNGTLQYNGNTVATTNDLNSYLPTATASSTYATIDYVTGITGTFASNVNLLNTDAVLKTGNQGISGIKTFEKISLDSTLTLNNTGTFLKDRSDNIAEIGDYGGGLFYNFEKGIIDVSPDTINGLIPSLKGNFDIITGYSRNSSATINKSGNVLVTYGYNHYPTDTTSDKTYVRIYTKSNDQNSFQLKQTITGDYFTDFRGFGYSAYGPYFGAHVSTSASGNILAISELFSPSPYNNLLSSGAVYIYTGNTGNGWSLKQKIFTPISGKDLSSMEMSENGDVFIVSNRNYYGDYFAQGIAYVYTGNTSDGWSLKQSLNNFNNQLMSGYYFGTSISIANSGKVFAIGVPNADNNSVDINGGAVVLYTGNKTDGWNIAQRILGTGIDRYLGSVVKLNNDGDILATNWSSGWGGNNRSVNGNINIYTGNQNKNYNLKQILDGYYLGSENNSTYFPSFGGNFEFANKGNSLIINHNAKIFKYNYLGNLEGVDWNIVSIFTGTKNNPYKFRDYISSYGNKYSWGDMRLDIKGVSENAKTLVVANHFGLNSADGVQFYIFNQTAYNNINFSRPPSVNGVQMLTKGDMPLKEQIVDTISSQSISGNKNFVVQPTYNGEKLAVLSGTRIPSSYIPSNINFNIKEIFLTTSGLSDKNKDYFSLENYYNNISEFTLNLISSFPYTPFNKYIINVGAYNNTGNTIALRFDPVPPIGSQIIIKNYRPQDNLSLGLTGVSGIRVIIPKYTGEEDQFNNDNLINIPYGDFINLTTTGQEFSIIRGIDNNGLVSFYKDSWPNYQDVDNVVLVGDRIQGKSGLSVSNDGGFFAGGNFGILALDGAPGTINSGPGGNAGSIYLNGADGSDGNGGNGGSINLAGGTDEGHGGNIYLHGRQTARGGSIYSRGGDQGSHGGSINLDGGYSYPSFPGGNIDLSNNDGASFSIQFYNDDYDELPQILPIQSDGSIYNRINDNLYIRKNGVWEKVATTFVDINNITGNFTFDQSFNSKLLTINAAVNITGTVPTGFPTGYNVSFAQMSSGKLFITGSGGAIVRQRLNLFTTAGQYGIASLLHHSGNQFLLYGDLN